MPPSAEPLLAMQETAPSLIGASIRIGLVLLLLVAGAWAWVYWQRRVKGPTRHLEVLDRAFLARGASVALLRADRRRLLVGVSSEGVRLIRELDSSHESSGGGFPAVLSATLREGEEDRS